MTTTTTAPALQAHRVAENTLVIPWDLPAPPVGHFPMNSLVIRGAEPVIVDTGAPACRGEWLTTAWDIVDPADVRWVFLSHDDRDHAGKVAELQALPIQVPPAVTLRSPWGPDR